MAGFFVIVVYIAAFVGYFMNIVKLIYAAVNYAPFGLLEVLRIVGLFTPLGPVIGYF